MMEKENLRIVFMGTPGFAVPCLDILVSNGYNIVGVITATDSYGGRGNKQLIQSDVKKYALDKGLNILQPPNLKSPAFLEELRSLKADLQVVVAFRMLPVVVWDMPRLGTINLHGSLLPRYRGAAPIHHAVMNGDKETGVTTFRLKHEIDTGDTIMQATMPIGDDENTGSVHDRMMILGAETMLKTVKMLCDGSAEPIPQLDQEATHAPKLFHHNCNIDFTASSRDVHNKIRGLSPFPGAWCSIDGKEYKVYTSVKDDWSAGPGTIKVEKHRMWIACASGSVEIIDIKAEGNRAMPVAQYLNGHKFDVEKVDL